MSFSSLVHKNISLQNQTTDLQVIRKIKFFFTNAMFI